MVARKERGTQGDMSLQFHDSLRVSVFGSGSGCWVRQRHCRWEERGGGGHRREWGGRVR